MPFFRQISRTVDGREIPGTFLSAYIHNGPYYLTEIKIYQDGMIDCWELVDFEGFKAKVASGWVVTTLPEGAHVSIHGLGRLIATSVDTFAPEAEFIKEVADEIDRLNDRPNSADKCEAALARFEAEQSEEARDALRLAYEAVPAHNRQYLLRDMDVQDIPIRMIIYGEDEIENWSHRVVARAQGIEPLPTIEVKGALKRKDGDKKS
jgi:hypothetical protein